MAPSRSSSSTTKKRPRSLKSGRPPILTNSQPSTSTSTPQPSTHPPRPLSTRAARTLIRATHTLRKRAAHARLAGDDAEVTRLTHALQAQGGLAAYQAASIQGQSAARGGDSSGVLVRWLREMLRDGDGGGTIGEGKRKRKGELRLLEVGALSARNACSRGEGRGVFGEVVRIDLHSQGAGIVQQDFMERPLPEGDGERFDVVSLSLVLNFVADAKGRGEMLRRTTAFLRRREDERGVGRGEGGGEGDASPTPALFLVLPAPCIVNSRYTDAAHLARIMASLGYVLGRQRQTAKLLYQLWLWDEEPWPRARQRFPKKLLVGDEEDEGDEEEDREGKGREGERRKKKESRERASSGGKNNFCIVLEA